MPMGLQIADTRRRGPRMDGALNIKRPAGDAAICDDRGTLAEMIRCEVEGFAPDLASGRSLTHRGGQLQAVADRPGGALDVVVSARGARGAGGCRRRAVKPKGGVTRNWPQRAVAWGIFSMGPSTRPASAGSADETLQGRITRSGRRAAVSGPGFSVARSVQEQSRAKR